MPALFLIENVGVLWRRRGGSFWKLARRVWRRDETRKERVHATATGISHYLSIDPQESQF